MPEQLSQEQKLCSISWLPSTTSPKPMQKPLPLLECDVSFHLPGRLAAREKQIFSTTKGCAPVSQQVVVDVNSYLCLFFLAGFCRWGWRKHRESSESWTCFWLSLEAGKWSKGKLGVLDQLVCLWVPTQRVPYLLDTKDKLAWESSCFGKCWLNVKVANGAALVMRNYPSEQARKNRVAQQVLAESFCFLVNNFFNCNFCNLGFHFVPFIPMGVK